MDTFECIHLKCTPTPFTFLTTPLVMIVCQSACLFVDLPDSRGFPTKLRTLSKVIFHAKIAADTPISDHTCDSSLELSAVISA